MSASANILRILRRSRSDGKTARELAEWLAMPRRNVSSTLYRLQKAGRIVKVDDQRPVLWALADGHGRSGVQ